MKRLKVLPSIVVLLLCIVTLCIGVYAAKPASHKIQGVINISAGDNLITICAYLNSTDNPIVEKPITVRGEGTLNLDPDAIKFVANGSYDADDIAPIKLLIGIKNHSAQELGAYFVKEPVVEGAETAMKNIATEDYLNGTDLNGNEIPKAIYALFQGYTSIPTGEVEVLLEIELTLEKSGDYQMDVPIAFGMNVELYNPPIE